MGTQLPTRNMCKKTILVLPGCDDKNRGDQALVWESVRVMKDIGFKGKYYMLTEETNSIQSKNEGLEQIQAILPHPSSHFKHLHDNRHYTILIKMLWGAAAVVDFIRYAPLQRGIVRRMVRPLISTKHKNTLEIYAKADVAIIKGGGFLHTSSSISDIYKMYYFLYHINMALSFGIPVYVMPNSFGPYTNAFERRMISKTLKECKIVLSRESISQRMLYEQCRIESLITMDLGAYLNKDTEFDCEKYLKRTGIPINKKQCVGITVRPHRYSSDNGTRRLYSKYIDTIVTLAQYIIDIGMYPVFIEQVYSNNYNESDCICINDIVNQLGRIRCSEYSIIEDRALNCRQLKALYSHLYCMIGTRFHSVIFSLFETVPAIAITYGGNKGQGIMQDLGLSEYTIPIEDVNPSLMISKFVHLMENYDMIVKWLESKKKICERQRAQLLQLLIEDIQDIK